MNDFDSNFTDLDESWISEFEKTDNNYIKFYKEDITSINICCIFVNKNLEMQKIKKTNIKLNIVNYLTKEEIISIIKRNNLDSISQVKYSLLSIVKYNINLDPINLNNFLKSNTIPPFLTVVKNIDNILLSPSIYLFQDLNEVLFIFCENTEKMNANNVTKRGVINHIPRNKTIRKQLKGIA